MAVQSDWLQQNYYAVLGVPETATDEEISRAYRRLARRLHPDVNPNNKEAEERFKEVSAAYEVIGDATKRKEYDEARRLMRAGGGRGFRGSPFGSAGDGGSRSGSMTSATSMRSSVVWTGFSATCSAGAAGRAAARRAGGETTSRRS